MKQMILASLAALWAMPAMADAILVELFASQNCQACPKAHETLAEVDAAREDVLILTWSVDYWDYLGDADPMAMPQSTARQSAYVETFNLRGPYTPQTVYNGHEQCPGNRPSAVDRRLRSVADDGNHGVVFSQSESGNWLVDIPAQVPCEVHLVEFLPAGAHETDMVHPVTAFETLAALDQGGTVATDADCAHGCALIVQAPGHGQVLAAKRLN